MNKIERINEFLRDYHTKSEYIQSITEPCYDYYQKLLIKEYLTVSKHPYPYEYLESS